MIKRPTRKPVPSWQPGQGQMSGEQRDHVIVRKCGHEETIKVYGDPAKSRYVAGLMEQDCRECYTQAMVDADTLSVDRGLRCQLDGGPRQIPWAQTVRNQRAADMRIWLANVTSIGAQLLKNKTRMQEEVDATIADVRQAMSDLMLGVEFSDEDYDHSGYAKYWIDGRKDTLDSIMARLLPDRDVLGAGVFVRLASDGWSPEVVDAEEIQRTATKLPTGEPLLVQDILQRKGRGPVKVSAGPAAAAWDNDKHLDLEDVF